MQKTIPFQKEINFKDNVSEITSISLEHSLHKEEDNQISGSFMISGEYKVVDTSSVIDRFSFDLPFDIHLDEKYDMSKVHIDIDDFYYEVVNNNILSVNIDVLIDRIEERIVPEEIEVLEVEDTKEDMRTAEAVLQKEDTSERSEASIDAASKEIEEVVVQEASLDLETNCEQDSEMVSKDIPEIKENYVKAEDVTQRDGHTVETISSIFENVSASGYATYHIYMVKEEDTIESVISKYGISKESLEKYND